MYFLYCCTVATVPYEKISLSQMGARLKGYQWRASTPRR